MPCLAHVLISHTLLDWFASLITPDHRNTGSLSKESFIIYVELEHSNCNIDHVTKAVDIPMRIGDLGKTGCQWGDLFSS